MLLFSLTDPVFLTPAHCNRMHFGNLIWPFAECQVLYPPGTGEDSCVLLMEVVDPRTNTLSNFVIVSKAIELFFKPAEIFCVSPQPF